MPWEKGLRKYNFHWDHNYCLGFSHIPKNVEKKANQILENLISKLKKDLEENDEDDSND